MLSGSKPTVRQTVFRLPARIPTHSCVLPDAPRPPVQLQLEHTGDHMFRVATNHLCLHHASSTDVLYHLCL